MPSVRPDSLGASNCYLKQKTTKVEDRGKPSLKRTIREDVPKAHTETKPKGAQKAAKRSRDVKPKWTSEEVDIELEDHWTKDADGTYDKELLKQ